MAETILRGQVCTFITAADIKAGDRIVSPADIKPYDIGTRAIEILAVADDDGHKIITLDSGRRVRVAADWTYLRLDQKAPPPCEISNVG